MDADVIVVGGGINGLWTGFHLTHEGKKTILFEQFPYPHTRGSSHGQSRITRSSYASEEYVAILPEANKHWKELEKETGKKLYLDIGCINMYNMKQNEEEFNSIIQNLKKHQINHEIIPGEQLSERFHGISNDSQYRGIFETNAGLLRADKCLSALQESFKSHGGELRDGEKVLSVVPINQDKVEVKTSIKTYTCKFVVLTCGPFINDLLASVHLRLPVQPIKVTAYYWKEKPGFTYSIANNFPVARDVSARVYFLPSCEYSGLVKICKHSGVAVDDPNTRDVITRKIEEEEKKALEELKSDIGIRFPGIDNSNPAIKETCMYTDSPDKNSILDFHPEHSNIVIGTGFSGTGFKTSPTVGGILAAMATGKQCPYPLEPFTLNRFNQ
uniref:peroxisomal sarcosine oxidase-like n=1 Tax=Styela clava TaxID=7725 RepID=UPI0019396A72|nr:peroxisomal sarcosine oxidase-like [Styela clava]